MCASSSACMHAWCIANYIAMDDNGPRTRTTPYSLARLLVSSSYISLSSAYVHYSTYGLAIPYWFNLYT